MALNIASNCIDNELLVRIYQLNEQGLEFTLKLASDSSLIITLENYDTFHKLATEKLTNIIQHINKKESTEIKTMLLNDPWLLYLNSENNKCENVVFFKTLEERTLGNALIHAALWRHHVDTLKDLQQFIANINANVQKAIFASFDLYQQMMNNYNKSFCTQNGLIAWELILCKQIYLPNSQSCLAKN